MVREGERERGRGGDGGMGGWGDGGTIYSMELENLTLKYLMLRFRNLSQLVKVRFTAIYSIVNY